MRQLFMAAILLISGNMLYAQVTTGTIKGKLFNPDSTELVPFASIWIEQDGSKRGVIADSNGNFEIDVLKPGIYNVHAKDMNYGEVIYAGVEVFGDAITFLNIVLQKSAIDLPPITVPAPKPIIDKNIPRIKIPLEYIEQSLDIRNPLGLLDSYSSEISVVEGSGQVIIRGSRPGDAVYYIDGVKATDMAMVPGAAVGSVEAYTGGIPAKYGDTTGGVVILETKSYFDLYNAWLSRQ